MEQAIFSLFNSVFLVVQCTAKGIVVSAKKRQRSQYACRLLKL